MRKRGFLIINGIEHPLSKAELRRSLLTARQSMPTEEWRGKSDHICNHLQSSPLFTSAKTILAYFSFRQEPDLNPLFVDSSHRWGFSRCVGDCLNWHIWKPGDLLQKGRFGILVPDLSTPKLKSTEVDLILVPAVACDEQGYRLGYGGGFYDRMLSSAEWASKPTIGIVFNFAYLPKLPIDKWDKVLQSVCTETGFNIVKF
ncbi:MAG TPA: 5-formyltetrahydrofolate cyclo-ligase [Coleofasciculaceae cyanobacterium]